MRPEFALAIGKGTDHFVLVIGTAYGCTPDGVMLYDHRWDHGVGVSVGFEDPILNSRPDPIRRAWGRLEAKWGMV